jgi:hypothetical protein
MGARWGSRLLRQLCSVEVCRYENCEMRTVVLSDGGGGGLADMSWFPGGHAYSEPQVGCWGVLGSALVPGLLQSRCFLTSILLLSCNCGLSLGPRPAATVMLSRLQNCCSLATRALPFRPRHSTVSGFTKPISLAREPLVFGGSGIFKISAATVAEDVVVVGRTGGCHGS